MKALFLAGGFAGFVLCSIAGLMAGRAPDLILRDAAIGCLAGALLVRWFWRVLLQAFKETLAVRRRAADEAAAAQESARAAKNAQPPKPSPAAIPAAAMPPPRPAPLVPLKPATR
jgi:hypothetical protein